MFSGYVLVSVCALSVDCALLFVLNSELRMDAERAAAIAYLIGGIVNYVLSRACVFRSGARGPELARELVSFAASCAFGAMLTVAIVSTLTWIVGPLVAKGIAIVVSFVVLYGVRRLLVFSTGTSGRPNVRGEPRTPSQGTGQWRPARGRERVEDRPLA